MTDRKKEIVKPTLTLFIICLVVSLLLGLTYMLTKDKIEEESKSQAAASRMIVLPGADTFDQISSDENGTAYIGTKGGTTIGYVFETSDSGYGGKLTVMTGITIDGTISGVKIVTNSETPGLGGNSTKPSFTDQYKQTAGEITVVKNKTADQGEIEAITGATITSKAVTRAVNSAVKMYETLKGGD